MIDLRLSERQRMIVDSAAVSVFTAQLDKFHKYVGDTLRCHLEIRDSSVRHAVCAALLKYGRRQ